jgi:hypothetical protein
MEQQRHQAAHYIRTFFIQHNTNIKMIMGITEQDYYNVHHAQNSSFFYTTKYTASTEAAQQLSSHYDNFINIDRKESGQILLCTIISKAYRDNK